MDWNRNKFLMRIGSGLGVGYGRVIVKGIRLEKIGFDGRAVFIYFKLKFMIYSLISLIVFMGIIG